MIKLDLSALIAGSMPLDYLNLRLVEFGMIIMPAGGAAKSWASFGRRSGKLWLKCNRAIFCFRTLLRKQIMPRVVNNTTQERIRIMEKEKKA